MVIVALDVGKVRIGVAICDEMEQMATPRATLRRVSNGATLDAIARIVAETGAGLLVVGLPISFDGRIHEQARSVLAFARKVLGRLRVPIVFADETLSTVRAEESLRAAGVRPERIREQIDAAAAAVILQDYLETRRVVDVEALSRIANEGTSSAAVNLEEIKRKRIDRGEEGMADG